MGEALQAQVKTKQYVFGMLTLEDGSTLSKQILNICIESSLVQTEKLWQVQVGMELFINGI